MRILLMFVTVIFCVVVNVLVGFELTMWQWWFITIGIHVIGALSQIVGSRIGR